MLNRRFYKAVGIAKGKRPNRIPMSLLNARAWYYLLNHNYRESKRREKANHEPIRKAEKQN